MEEELTLQSRKDIESLIFTVRGVQVMIDRDLAQMYQVETRTLNQAVKRNLKRFPGSFRFQLSALEFENWKSQIVMSKKDKMGLRRPPFAFTEQGVAMLSAVMSSEIAIEVSIRIMEAFIEMRKIMITHAGLLQRMDRFEITQIEHGQKIEQVFKALEANTTEARQGIFFDGQIFDAYTFTAKLIRSAKKSIQLIDNYVDDSVLLLLSKKNKGVTATIYTRTISKVLEQDLEKHNAQYAHIEIKQLDKVHDRFLVIDKKVYHIGASMKDLGKKWFAFSLMEKDALGILERLE